MNRHALTLLLPVGAALLLSACGQRHQMTFATDRPGPALPVGAAQTPTAGALQTPSVQARPQRSDELRQRSDERQPDPFDLPPA